MTKHFFIHRIFFLLGFLGAWGGMLSLASAEELLGESPLQVLKDAKQHRECYRFQKYTVVKTKDWLMIKQGGKASLCHKGKARLYIKADDMTRFRGIVREYALVAIEQGSDFFDLEIHSIRSKQLVWKRASMPPNASLSYDRTSGQLSFMAEIKPPDACAKSFKPEQYNEMLRACWGQIQRAYPALQRVKTPTCTCQGGLGPYLTVSHHVHLGKSPLQTKISHLLKCGCAS